VAFEVPKPKLDMEDSILEWLSEPEEEEAVSQPRVIDMSSSKKNGEDSTDSSTADDLRGPIRRKSTPSAQAG
jgi:hypothetical protein